MVARRGLGGFVMASVVFRRYFRTYVQDVGATTIGGTVKVLTTPLPRCPVYLLEQDGLRPIRETVSDGAGAYSFPNMEPDRPYIVMAIDPTGAYNAVLADRVQT